MYIYLLTHSILYNILYTVLLQYEVDYTVDLPCKSANANLNPKGRYIPRDSRACFIYFIYFIIAIFLGPYEVYEEFIKTPIFPRNENDHNVPQPCTPIATRLYLKSHLKKIENRFGNLCLAAMQLSSGIRLC